MTFIDMALFVGAEVLGVDALRGVTVDLNVQFVGGGDLVRPIERWFRSRARPVASCSFGVRSSRPRHDRELYRHPPQAIGMSGSSRVTKRCWRRRVAPDPDQRHHHRAARSPRRRAGQAVGEGRGLLRGCWARPPRRCAAFICGAGSAAANRWLMDLFYECVPIESKRRVHFHEFHAQSARPACGSSV